MGQSFDGGAASDPAAPANAKGRALAEAERRVLLNDRILPDHAVHFQWLRADPTVQLIRLPILVWLTLWVLAGCQTAQQRKAAENAAVNRQAADEITRICALHSSERDAELKKLKAASGLDLYCPGE